MRTAPARKVAIIGDRFMLPDIFEQHLLSQCNQSLSIRKYQGPWPDEPMENGYAAAGMDGLKEYSGSFEQTVRFIADAEILVTHLAPLSRAMLERLPDLKLIAVSRGGPVNIDVKAARDYGVQVVNAPGRNSTAVAEFTIGAILMETRRLRVGHEALRAGRWRGDLYRADVTGRELSEMTVGIIGYGEIGTRVVKLLRPFGCRILVDDPYVALSRDDHEAGVEAVDLNTLLARADVISLHPRVTDETHHMINATTLALMKPDALLLNTARGPLVDYDALFTALTNGILGSAMLETFGTEPVPADTPLLQLPNVTLTPHIAGASVRTITCAAEQAANEIRRYLAGQAPGNPC